VCYQRELTPIALGGDVFKRNARGVGGDDEGVKEKGVGRGVGIGEKAF
jgi:hypothetical protein